MTNDKKITPFTYVAMVNNGEVNNEKVDDSVYNQFLLNRNFSLFVDTIGVANIANSFKNVPNDVHFKFLQSNITPRKRFAQWPKPVKHPKAKVLSQYFDISMSKAYDMVGIYSDEDIKQLEDELSILENGK